MIGFLSTTCAALIFPIAEEGLGDTEPPADVFSCASWYNRTQQDTRETRTSVASEVRDRCAECLGDGTHQITVFAYGVRRITKDSSSAIALRR